MWISRKRYDELKEVKSVNEALKSTINNLEEENSILKVRIKERDKIIEQEFKNKKKLKDRIIDLENNVEFLVNNLSKAKQNQIKKPSHRKMEKMA